MSRSESETAKRSSTLMDWSISDVKAAPHDSGQASPSEPAVQPLDWARTNGAGEAVRFSVGRHVRRRRWRQAILAGTGALVIAVGVFTAWKVPSLRVPPVAAVVAGKANVIAPERR